MAALSRLPITHDIHHLQAALEMIPAGGVCIEGGAHRGIWTRLLVQHFRHVYAFEPNEAHFEELLSVAGNRASCYNLALMDQSGYFRLQRQPGATNDGQYRVQPDGSAGEKVFAVTLDQQPWPADLTFIKLDVEGAELCALMGAAETIAKHRPFVMVEQNSLSETNFDLHAHAAGALLEEWGMVLKHRWNKDFLYGWPA